MNALLLAGRDYAELGAVGEAAANRIAVALSRGGAEKRYAYTDPNEDVALAASGRHGMLVAVADGHWGSRAAEVALAQLRDADAAAFVDGGGRSADGWYQQMLAALVAVNDAILAAHVPPDEKPRTTLALGLARPREDLLVLASAGDSHLFAAGPGFVSELLPRPRRSCFLGDAKRTPSQIEKEARIDVRPLGDVRALFAATDGISEHGIGIAEPSEAIEAAMARASSALPQERAAVAARAVLDAALAAHVSNDAGDNIAVAVAWLEARR